MIERFSKTIDRFIPLDVRVRVTETCHARLLIAVALLATPFWLIFSIGLVAAGAYSSAIVSLVMGLGLTSMPLWIRRGVCPLRVGQAAGGLYFVGMTAMAALEGGFPPAPVLWLFVLPLIAVLLGSRTIALLWTGAIVAELVIFFGLAGGFPLGGAPSELIDRGIEIGGFAFLLFGLAWACDFVWRSAEADRHRLARQLDQAHRLESVGEVAGALTHDFNNLLTVVQSYGSLLLDDLTPDDPRYQDVREIIDAASRGAELTQALSTFARNRELNLEPLDPARELVDMEPVLKSLAGDRIELRLKCDGPLPAVEADREQLRRVLMNLVLNAKDAITTDGSITIEARLIDLDPRQAAGHIELRPGRFVRVTVRDTGCGMPPEILDRIFEPFYSTKPKSRGLGLGLSTAYGLIRAFDGHLLASSEVGGGSRFYLYLPVTARRPAQVSVESAPMAAVGSRGTVLLVDDRPAVARSTEQLLVREGYVVYCATDAAQAIVYFSEHQDEIDLLLTDVVMPDMSGPELADELLGVKPDLRVLYMSGYTGELADPAVRSGGHFLHKPFTRKGLLKAVRRAIRGTSLSDTRKTAS